MPKYPYCPNCGHGGEDAYFYEIDILYALAHFRPVLTESGKVEVEYAGESTVDWDSQKPAKEHGLDVPLYQCPICATEFDRFIIMDLDDDEDNEEEEDEDEEEG